jgi:hypothetical protein
MVKMRHRNMLSLLLLWIWPVCSLNAHPPEYEPVSLPERPRESALGFFGN